MTVTMRDRPRRSLLRVTVRTFGELLVSAGVLVGLFLVWQLVWTDVVAASAANRALDELRQEFVATDADPSRQPSTPTQPAPTAEPAPASGLTSGDGLAIVSIPSIEAEIPVLEGIELDVLNQGVLGHYPHSELPGEVGNFSVAGHRNTWGKPLHRLAEVEPGDAVVVEVAEGWHVYTYERHRIVYPHQTEVLAQVPDQPGAEPSEPWMVLTACHPIFSAEQRIVGYAVHDRFVPRDEGTPVELPGAEG